MEMDARTTMGPLKRGILGAVDGDGDVDVDVPMDVASDVVTSTCSSRTFVVVVFFSILFSLPAHSHAVEQQQKPKQQHKPTTIDHTIKH